MAGARSSGAGAIGIDYANDGIDLDGGAFLHFHFFEHTTGGRRDFGVHFVGGDFEERLVALDTVAGLLQPLGDGAFNNGLPHLGHDDVSGHVSSYGKFPNPGQTLHYSGCGLGRGRVAGSK